MLGGRQLSIYWHGYYTGLSTLLETFGTYTEPTIARVMTKNEQPIHGTRHTTLD